MSVSVYHIKRISNRIISPLILSREIKFIKVKPQVDILKAVDSLAPGIDNDGRGCLMKALEESGFQDGYLNLRKLRFGYGADLEKYVVSRQRDKTNPRLTNVPSWLPAVVGRLGLKDDVFKTVSSDNLTKDNQVKQYDSARFPWFILENLEDFLNGKFEAVFSPGNLISYSRNQIQMFSPARIRALSPYQIQMLVPDQIRALLPPHIQALSPKQIEAFASDIKEFLPTQIQALLPSQIRAFTPVQIRSGLSNGGQIWKFSPEQIGAFTEDQIRVFATYPERISVSVIARLFAKAPDDSTRRQIFTYYVTSENRLKNLKKALGEIF